MTQQKLEICKEDKLLLLCARTQMSDEIKTQILSLVQQDINWDYLLKKSYEHRLTPYSLLATRIIHVQILYLKMY